MKKEWFDEWFDTKYYHVLYKNRDYNEASKFIEALLGYFKIPSEAKILDLACGKGRHSIFLNEKGHDVTGVDLSEQSISAAKEKENDRLKFDVHDMRNVYQTNGFDYILNLFTSFGYLGTKEENLQVIEAAIASLKPGGKFLLDFLNPYVVINNLVSAEEKTIDNIHFRIEREYTADEFIVKKIEVTDGEKTFHFQEKVKAIRRTDFLAYFEQLGLTVVDVFGNYQLSNYQKEKSTRLIFVLQK